MKKHHMSKSRDERIKKTEKLFIKGYTNKEISKELNINEETVEEYFSEIKEKSNIIKYNYLIYIYFWHNKKGLFALFLSMLILLIGSLIYFSHTLLNLNIELIKILFDMIERIFEANLSGIFSIDILLSTIILIVFFMSFTIILKGHSFFISKKKINWWVWGTIYLMVFFLIVGLFFINKATTQELNFGLNNENKNLTKAGFDLKCEGESKRLIYDSEYVCHIENSKNQSDIKIENFKGTATFRSNSENLVLSFNETIRFNVPINSTYILIKISGKYQEENINWSSGRPFNFITKEKEEEIRKEFLSNLFILFTLVFFSIPTMIVSFKKLAKKE